MLVGNGEGEAFHDGEEVFPDEAFEGDVLVVEEVTGVKGEPDGHAVELPPVAAEAGHVHFLRTEKLS